MLHLLSKPLLMFYQYLDLENKGIYYIYYSKFLLKKGVDKCKLLHYNAGDLTLL